MKFNLVEWSVGGLMAENLSFFSNKRFFDDQHFPYGFDRSGEFTSLQAKLLTDHGRAYEGLSTGFMLPTTKEEEDFVAFVQGQRQAETAHEKTWKKYLDSCNRAMEYHAVALTRPNDFSEDVSLDMD